MRAVTGFLMVTGLTALLPLPAHAADDFGSRFGGSAPPALSSPEESAPAETPPADTVAATAPAADHAADNAAAQELQNIAPAAGAPPEQSAPEQAFDEVIPPKVPASTHDGYEREIENQTP